MADKVIYWSKTALTGGAAGALDSIDGTALQDGEVAHVWISNVLYIYLLDVDSGAAESSPAIIAPDTNAGDKRWILQSYYSGSGTLYTDHIAESTSGHGVEIDGLTIKDSGFAIGSDADGDMYYRASSVLARLAKGTANYKLFMNAAATAPEWAKGMKVLGATRDLTAAGAPTDVAYTDVGFKPGAILSLATVPATHTWCVGAASGAAEQGVIWSLVANYLSYASALLGIAVDGSNYQSATLKTFDSDGFTLTWTKTGSPTGTANIIFLCFR